MKRAALRALIVVLRSAIAWVIALGVASAALVTVGVLQLAGGGWACIAAGVYSLAYSALIARGAAHG